MIYDGMEKSTIDPEVAISLNINNFVYDKIYQTEKKKIKYNNKHNKFYDKHIKDIYDTIPVDLSCRSVSDKNI